jgi:hypothetical protein
VWASAFCDEEEMGSYLRMAEMAGMATVASPTSTDVPKKESLGSVEDRSSFRLVSMRLVKALFRPAFPDSSYHCCSTMNGCDPDNLFVSCLTGYCSQLPVGSRKYNNNRVELNSRHTHRRQKEKKRTVGRLKLVMV